MKASVAQLCLTLCDSIDRIPSGSFVHGILQARILEWVAIYFFGGPSWAKGSKPGLLHCRQIFYWLSYKGSPFLIVKKRINYSSTPRLWKEEWRRKGSFSQLVCTQCSRDDLWCVQMLGVWGPPTTAWLGRCVWCGLALVWKPKQQVADTPWLALICASLDFYGLDLPEMVTQQHRVCNDRCTCQGPPGSNSAVLVS